MKATHRTVDRRNRRGKTSPLQPGQFTTGRYMLHADFYGCEIGAQPEGAKSPRSVWRWLTRLEELGNIRIDSSHRRYSTVTVNNWVFYQGSQGGDTALNSAHSCPPKNSGQPQLAHHLANSDPENLTDPCPQGCPQSASTQKHHLNGDHKTGCENDEAETVQAKLPRDDHQTRNNKNTRIQGSPGTKCIAVEDAEPFARAIFKRLEYTGRRGANLWRTAALWSSGMISEADVVDAAEGSRILAHDRPAYFYRSLEARLALRGIDLKPLLKAVRLEPRLPTGPPAPPVSHLEAVAHLSNQLAAD